MYKQLSQGYQKRRESKIADSRAQAVKDFLIGFIEAVQIMINDEKSFFNFCLFLLLIFV